MARSWPALRTSAVALVLANVVPLVGVVAFGWDLHSLLVVYWLESAVVGGLTIPKMVRAADLGDPGGATTLAGLAGAVGADDDAVTFLQIATLAGRIGFFCFHYGLFWVVHGVFVLRFPSFFPGLMWASPAVVVAGSVGLLVSHAVSYRRNYVGEREYADTTPKELMSEPYRRVVVLHMTIVLGAFGIASLDAPAGVLAVMVVVKTGLDLRGHWREHRPGRRRIPV